MAEISPNNSKNAADQISQNLREIKTRMDAARPARQTHTPRLIAVSKTFPPEHILPALEAGHRCFGENRVQESEHKWPALKQTFSDVELHLIGPLQTNKIKTAVGLFDWIHSVDRQSLAEGLAKQAAKTGDCPQLLVQVNTGSEAQKAGIEPEKADAFIGHCRKALDLPVRGLMCIPPINEEPSLHFALLAKIAHRNGLSELSMGMSADFETALGFGATMVRVGSAIFGPRPKPPQT